MALKDAGFPVETETVVTLAAEHRRGLFAHLARTLAAEGITIGYSYSAAVDGRSLVVLRTDSAGHEVWTSRFFSYESPRAYGLDIVPAPDNGWTICGKAGSG